jgi:hypothetical protein
MKKIAMEQSFVEAVMYIHIYIYIYNFFDIFMVEIYWSKIDNTKMFNIIFQASPCGVQSIPGAGML